MNSLICSSPGYGDTTALHMRRATGGALLGKSGIWPQIRMRPPSLQLLVNGDEKFNVLRIVLAHEFPCLEIAVDAIAPELGAGMRDLMTDTEVAAELIQTGGIKLEFAGDFKRINRFVGSGWWEFVDGEARFYPWDVETVEVVPDHDICA